MSGRLVGLIAGVVVGMLFSGAALNLGGSEDDVQHIPFGLLAAGAAGGLVFGPVAWRAGSRSSWIGAMVGFALLAALVLLGVAATAAAVTEAAAYPAGVTSSLLGDAVLLFTYMLVVVGWLLAPLALLPAAIWTVLVWAIRRLDEANLRSAEP